MIGGIMFKKIVFNIRFAWFKFKNRKALKDKRYIY